MKIYPSIWAGSDASYAQYLANDEAISLKMANSDYQDEEDEEDTPYLFEKQDGVGIVSIKGPITNREVWYNSIFKVASYGAIREALLHAAQDPEVTQILLDIDSGGGAVAGLFDTANLISMINDKVKPVTTYGGDSMCSAAYALGVSAGKVYAGRTSTVGSIGVIATHMEYSKQLAADGVGVTVIRSGKRKALVSNLEPLSPEAEAVIREQIGFLDQMFVEHVAASLNVPYAYAKENIAQEGREFFGEAAKEVGLIDDVTSFDAVMAELIKNSDAAIKNTVDYRGGFGNNQANTQLGGAMRTLTTEQVPAAAEVEKTEVQAAAEQVVQAAVAAPAADNAVVAMLQSQLKDAQASLMQANVEHSKLKDQYDAMAAAQAGLLAIAAQSVNTMRVAMKMPAIDAAMASAAALLAEHQSLSTQFATQFPVGGVAAVATEPEDKKAKPATLDAMSQARLNAIHLK